MHFISEGGQSGWSLERHTLQVEVLLKSAVALSNDSLR